MTHFVTMIAVPKEVVDGGQQETEDYIWDRMKPFIESGTGDCERQYEEWEVETPKDKIEEEAKKIYEDFKDRDKKEDSQEWELKAREKYIKLFEQGKFVEICQDYSGGELNEEGDLGYWNNNDSFFDWYRIGGRWSGVITGDKRESDGGFNFSKECEQLENNHISAKILLEKATETIKNNKIKREGFDAVVKDIEDDHFTHFGFYGTFCEAIGKERDDMTKEDKDNYNKILKTFSENLKSFQIYNGVIFNKIIDLSGEVHTNGEYGWWGMHNTDVDPNDWEEEYLGVLKEAAEQNAHIVNLDCHV